MDREEFDWYGFWTRYWVWITLLLTVTSYGGRMLYLHLEPEFNKKEYAVKMANPETLKRLRATVLQIEAQKADIATEKQSQQGFLGDADKMVASEIAITQLNSGVKKLEVKFLSEIGTMRDQKLEIPDDLLKATNTLKTQNKETK